MNIVIAADKKYTKIFKDSLTQHNILGFENELKNNFVSRIADHYNPHVLIVVNGVRSRKFDFFAALPELRKQCPTMRIIYFFGRLTDETEQSYLDVCGKMFPYGYYEIVPYDMYERGFRSKIAEILEKPLTGEDVKKLISDRQEEKIHTEILMQSIEKIIDTTPVSFAKDEVEADYDDTQVERFDEPQELLTEKQGEHITMAIGTISEKQAGCTQTALEIAILLMKSKQSVAVFLEDETYENYISYHGIESAPSGCQVNDLTLFPLSVYKEKKMYVRFAVNDLTLFPLSVYKEKKMYVRFAVLDVGYAPIIPEDAAYPFFESAEIKICICSFNEWDISKLADYLNSPLSYIKEINYIFFPVSEKNFVKFQKQMDKGHCKSFRIRNSPDYTEPKGHCKSFRIRNSPDYTEPCEWNIGIYNKILNTYIDLDISKPKKRFLFGLL